MNYDRITAILFFLAAIFAGLLALAFSHNASFRLAFFPAGLLALAFAAAAGQCEEQARLAIKKAATPASNNTPRAVPASAALNKTPTLDAPALSPAPSTPHAAAATREIDLDLNLDLDFTHLKTQVIPLKASR